MKIKFLTVVWGETYIKNFCELSLPSWVAPGNLPALGRVGQLEVCIMSQQKDFKIFSRFRPFKTLEKEAKVTLVPIDDLITENVYGVTLTLAYARPILALGDRMVEYHFVFMNADFVLADGSLDTLAKVLQSGETVVLAPSLRVVAEKTMKKLCSRVKRRSGVLAMAPRELLGIGLPHLHPTTWGKMLNFGKFHTIHPNQLFWQVDKSTLLARYFLIFMLALKPNRVIRDINSWCDYGFVPEFCPGIQPRIMNDSDEFLMMEFQERLKEKELLRLGPLPSRSVAASLQAWATLGHLKNSESEIIFHQHELPVNLNKEQKNFCARLRKLRVEQVRPRSHRFHPYWISGLQAWQKDRKRIGDVPELASLPWLDRWKQRWVLGFDEVRKKHAGYLHHPEEALMSPRLAALIKVHRKCSQTRNKVTILAESNCFSTGLILGTCAGKEQKTKTALVWLPENLTYYKSPEKSFEREAAFFIGTTFPPWLFLKDTLQKYRYTAIYVLPNSKKELIETKNKVLDAMPHLIEHKLTLQGRAFADRGFWLMRKVYHLTKAFSINNSQHLQNIIRALLGNELSFIQIKKLTEACKRWRIPVPTEILDSLIQSKIDHAEIDRRQSGNTGLFLKERLLVIFGVRIKIYLTNYKSPAFLKIPRIRIPLFYKAAYLCERILRNNGLARKVIEMKWLRDWQRERNSSLLVFTFVPENPGKKTERK